jgi:DNA-binding NtrC family response regulator
VTAFGTVAQAVEALRQGADDFLTKPLDLDHLRLRVSRVLESRRIQQQLVHYQELLREEGFHGLIGRSRSMQRLFSQIRQVARGSGPVLIVGESGVGKELVVRAIHRESDRSNGPFIAVNCASIPEALMESEFFGHAPGAFTGAAKARKGLFVEANGGTLLLDEITELPLPLQAKLLRVLQERRVRAVGSDGEREVDVRIVAATNRDPELEAESGSLRADLFYRLETFTIKVPPLRDREDDLELLTSHFLRRFSAQLNKDIQGLEPRTVEQLGAYDFPGNVRELQNAMERAVTFCEGQVISLRDLPPRIRNSPNGRVQEQEGQVERSNSKDILDVADLPSLAELESRYINFIMDRTGGNKRRAADLLGIGRRTLYRRLEGDSTQGGK